MLRPFLTFICLSLIATAIVDAPSSRAEVKLRRRGSRVCEIDYFLKSLIYYDPAHLKVSKTPHISDVRSRWAKRPEIATIEGDFAGLKRVHSQTPTVHAGSLAERKRELLDVLDELKSMQKRLHRFESEFPELGYGQATYQDIADFYQTRLKLFENGVEEVHHLISQLSPTKAIEFQEGYAKRIRAIQNRNADVYYSVKRYLKAIETGANPAGDIDEIVEKLVDRFDLDVRSILGEMQYFVTLPDVKAASVFVNQHEVSDLLESRILALKSDAKNGNLNPKRLMKDYPTWFKRDFRGKAFDELSREEMVHELDFLHKIMRQKEIDLIRTEGSVERWVEIKSHLEPVTWESFTDESRGKSIMRQLLEDHELLKISGVNNRIQLEFHALGGIDPKVSGWCNRNGIHVPKTIEPGIRAKPTHLPIED